ncbi:hypothetical protein Rsub_00944 [Raphidocelis subcapitata]|uniref:Leucine-rich repeat-containing N-terminal plant-type domain-containing protein n=1 Tax=Raphidocelis subcapitata TaxID=307507 RepID=A0A2V0NNZ2_9CHLO|nr:hypothetical protein Rsub_00944 [Raphidocelis subcapitata]|eukprot:GBF88232.1 hypothetical protein Rsub_00944 [Raphidocelis subcapitata]
MPPGDEAGHGALPHRLLLRICALLPPGGMIFTVPRLSKALAAWAAPQRAQLRAELRAAVALHASDRMSLGKPAIEAFSAPLWALQEAWPALTGEQQALAAERAAFHGDVAALGWVLPRLARRSRCICEAAAAGGQLEALQCARQHGCPWGATSARAAMSGQLAVLQWALAQEPPCPSNEHICDVAALGGQLAVLQWARAQDPPYPWDEGTCRFAARYGCLAVLQWARAQEPPCPWDETACSRAALGGHLAVLQWARAQDPPCPWDEVTCRAAGEGGHLAVLQWARAQDPPCPWDELTCEAAAKHGHLAMLQWARAQDPPCPWNEVACEAAAGAGHLAVLQWLRAQDPPCPWNFLAYFFAGEFAEDEDVAYEITQWIRKQVRRDGGVFPF